MSEKFDAIVMRLLNAGDLEAAYAIQHLQARELELEELSDRLHHRNVELNQELYGSGRMVIRGYAENERE